MDTVGSPLQGPSPHVAGSGPAGVSKADPLGLAGCVAHTPKEPNVDGRDVDVDMGSC